MVGKDSDFARVDNAEDDDVFTWYQYPQWNSQKANKGVVRFFKWAIENESQLYLSVITIGELRRGIELIRYRRDTRQANLLEKWLNGILSEYQDFILNLDVDIAQLWGKFRSPHHENEPLLCGIFQRVPLSKIMCCFLRVLRKILRRCVIMYSRA